MVEGTTNFAQFKAEKVLFYKRLENNAGGYFPIKFNAFFTVPCFINRSFASS